MATAMEEYQKRLGRSNGSSSHVNSNRDSKTGDGIPVPNFDLEIKLPSVNQSLNNNVREEQSSDKPTRQCEPYTLPDDTEQKPCAAYSPHFKCPCVRLKDKTCCPPPTSMVNGYEIPLNIKHKIGSHVVSELIADKEGMCKQACIVESREGLKNNDKSKRLIEKVAKEQEKLNAIKQKMIDDVNKPDGYEEDTYTALSNALRSNTFPGKSWDQQEGMAHASYKEHSFDKRGRPITKYNYQKNPNTVWRESFFNQQQSDREFKKWQEEKAAAKTK